MNKQKMVEHLVTNIKEKYIREEIGMRNNEIFDKIVRVLCLYDYDTDKTIAEVQIDDSVTDIESWFMFKGETLKNRWNEVCGLARENMAYLACDNTARQLLQFLIDNLDVKQKAKLGGWK